MAALKNIFLEDSKIAFDKKHRKTINFNIGRYNDAVDVENSAIKIWNWPNNELPI